MSKLFFKIILFFVLISNSILAQANSEDCKKIKINDSLTVESEDYVLDKVKKIDIRKTILDSTNIKSVYVIQSPCAKYYSGTRGVNIIERKNKFPILEINQYLNEKKIEYKEYNDFKVVINGNLIENPFDYFVEITNKTKINIIIDKIREHQITFVFTQN